MTSIVRADTLEPVLYRKSRSASGVLVLGAGDSRQNTVHRAGLLDAAGRKVLDLRSGPNDASLLVPGMYFVRYASGVKRYASGVTKVLLTR